MKTTHNVKQKLFWTILTTMSILCAYLLGNASASYLPNASEYYIEQDNISFRQIQELIEESSPNHINGTTDEEVRISGKQKDMSIRAILRYTDENYPRVHNVFMVKGGFFTAKTQALSRQIAIISEELSIRFFQTNDVIGQEIEINGKPFQIIGVYKGASSRMAQLSSDGKDRIFTSYYASEEKEELKVQTLYCSPQNIGDETWLSSLVYRSNGAHHADRKISLQSFSRLPICIFLLLLLFFLFRSFYVNSSRELSKMWKKRKESISDYKEEPEMERGMEKWMRIGQSWSKTLLIAVLIMGSIVILLSMDLQFPGLWSDKKQVFSPGYYGAGLVNTFQEHNSRSHYSFYANVYFYTTILLSMFSFTVLILSYRCMKVLFEKDR